MNLAWLAAVLQPRDVAPHPNFPDDESNRDGPAQLAGIVLGGDWARGVDLADLDSHTRGYLSLVQKCLDVETIATAVPQLAECLVETPPSDLAASAALSLMLTLAGAETDDFITVLAVLNGLLPRLHSDGPDEALVRAVVLQQIALRSRDAGEPYVDRLRQVGELLETMRPDACSTFPTSAGVAWESVETLTAIKVSLLHAASSLWPSGSGKPAAPLLESLELVRRRPSPAAVRRAMASEAEYTRFVEQVFAARDETGVHRFGGPRGADLFRASMSPELMGSGSAYAARKDLALLRLVQADASAPTIADALRLLRHAGAKRELDMQLRRLEAGGPLAALSADARQIIRMRLSPELLRTLEVQVLAAASQILTRAEADAALDAVIGSLNRGGPLPPAGRWELEIVRRETAWAAIVALADTAGRADAAAELLLGETLRISEDTELADKAMRRAVLGIDWTSVSDEVKQAWREWIDGNSSEFAGTAEVVSARLDVLLDDAAFGSDLDRLVYCVNARLRGVDDPPPIPAASEGMLRLRLTDRRDEFRAGHFAFGGVEEADVAAAFLVVGAGQELWPVLTEFLVDTHVPRAFKSAALDRLATMRPTLPQESVAVFRSHIDSLLGAPALEPFDSRVVPYPPALRFLATYGLLDRAETYAALATLAGSADPFARREAAESVSVLAGGAPADELLALALPLSHDVDVEVRARAGRALASLAMHEGVLAGAAERRALELLDTDGLRVPLLVVRALSEPGSRVPNSIAERLRELALEHPSVRVRRAANYFRGGHTGSSQLRV